jgi:hypothetical protein
MGEMIAKDFSELYSYPLEQLAKWPSELHAVVKYDDLVQDPGKTVLDLYERFGFLTGEEFHRILQNETEKAPSYKSRHSYSLDQFGLTHEQIVDDYREVFDRFGFDTKENATTAE